MIGDLTTYQIAMLVIVVGGFAFTVKANSLNLAALVKQFVEFKKELKKVAEKVDNHGERLARLETWRELTDKRGDKD